MFTNTAKFGGYFKSVIDNELADAKSVSIASGYTSLDVINSYKDIFIKLASEGGVSRLLIGMAFYEGLSKKKLDALNALNLELLKFKNNSGIYVAYGRPYHGKVYHFSNDNISKLFVGSSNFSSSGTKINIECTIPVTDEKQKAEIKRFLDDLYSPTNSLTIDKAEITVPGKKKPIQKTVQDIWYALKRYNPKTIDKSTYPRFNFPLDRVAEKEKSNLNVYFGKGRLNTKTGKIIPRPWYEIELIADKDINTNPVYPKGNFLAFTDDGYIIPMRTQGDYFKNIRSKSSLQIFGIWLKGKMERSGALKKFEPVSLDTLAEYGRNNLTFYKMDDGKFYLEF
jgi:hypothetical protein